MQLARPESVDAAVAALADGAVALSGGTEVVPLLRDGISRPRASSTCAGAVPRGISGRTIGAGATLAELEASTGDPGALREACRLAASPQLRNMGTIGGNLLQATRCWYWRLKFPCRLHGGDTLPREGRASTASTRSSRTTSAPRLIRPTRPRRCSRSAPAIRTDRRELGSPSSTACRPRTTARRRRSQPDELILELELPEVEASTYLKAMDRQRWAFALVGVAAARVGGETRIALAGAAPDPVAARVAE